MSNLFHIMFANFAVGDPGYNTVAHQLIDTTGDRKIISLSLTADKLQSVSNYTREPRRLEFTCFMDAWLEEYLFSGNYELDNYISKYSVQLYRDGVLLFTGLIDASLLKHDVAADIVTVGCYDVIRLYSLDDGDAFFNPLGGSGYTAGEIHDSILAYLQRFSGFKCASDLFHIYQPFPTFYTEITLGTFSTPQGIPDGIYSSESINFTRSGWYMALGQTYIEFVFIHKSDLYTADEARYLYLSAHIWRFYNLICPVKADFTYAGGWTANDSDKSDEFDRKLDEFNSFIDENLKLNFEESWGGAATDPELQIQWKLIQGSCDFWDRSYSYTNDAESYTVSFAGNALPTTLQVGNRYENIDDAKYSKNIDVIKAMLLLYNATIVANAGGNVMLCYKGGWDETITDIDQADIVSYSRTRGDWEKPDLDTLSPLTGDTSAYLAPVVLANLRAYYGQKWQLELSVDKLDKYDLALFAKIRVQGNIYGITELQLDFEADEYKLKAVQL